MSNTNYILTSDGSFISDEALYHYGIKGMRWGIRRYQNPDGSLTNKGKKRHEVLSSAADKAKNVRYGQKRFRVISQESESSENRKNLAIPNIEKL